MSHHRGHNLPTEDPDANTKFSKAQSGRPQSSKADTTTDWIKHWLPELNPNQVTMLETYIRTHQLDLVDQFRDHIEGAYEAVEMAMGEAYYQITQADKKVDNE